MDPIILSSLLLKEKKNYLKLFPLKLLIIIVLVIFLSLPWLFGKVFRGKNGSSSILRASPQTGCWSGTPLPCAACGGCEGCGGCGGCWDCGCECGETCAPCDTCFCNCNCVGCMCGSEPCFNCFCDVNCTCSCIM